MLPIKDISLPIAFGAGVLSFFSPCVLPLIPAYLSFITGLSIDKLTESDERSGVVRNLGRIVWPTVLFVLGFSFIFVSLGASATWLGNFISANQRIIRIVGGIIVILFGLHIAGLFKIRFLQYEKKLHLGRKPTNIFGPFIIGAVFAIGWTPCLGPILGSVLTYAATQDTVGEGIMLLSSYSLGLGLPFIMTAMAVSTFLGLFNRVKKHFRVISIISGLLLVIFGILIIGSSFSMG